MVDVLLPLLVADILTALYHRNAGNHDRVILPCVQFDHLTPSRKVIIEASNTIRNGGIVLYPSDTIYGLGCDPFNQKALHRLFQIKGRRTTKGVLILINNLDLIECISEATPKVFYKLMEEMWPGPVTCLLKGRRELPAPIVGEHGKVGVRYPDLPFLWRWMEAIPGPIVSTSANRSGQPNPQSTSDLRHLFYHRVDLFLESEMAQLRSRASTVVDLTQKSPKIVRRGAAVQRVEEFLRKIVF